MSTALFLLLNSIVSNPCGAKVACGDGCWWLGMAELGEYDADYRCFTRIEEEGAEFCFGGGGEYVIDYRRENVYCSVEG